MEDRLEEAINGWWPGAAEYLVPFVKLLLAGLAGACLGWEREAHEKAAGLRTHMLLAMGACLFTIVAVGIQHDFTGTDVMRIIQGTLIGTGFICGGVIFRHGGAVHGLTTAAGLWIMGAVGVAVGLGEYYLAGVTVLLTFLAMTMLRRGKKRIRERYAEEHAEDAYEAARTEPVDEGSQ